jgi:hypothetical protein
MRNNSTGQETLEQLVVIVRDIQSVLHSTTSELYRTTYRNSTLLHVPTRQVSVRRLGLNVTATIASTIDDGLSVIFSVQKRRNCAHDSNEQNTLLGVY